MDDILLPILIFALCATALSLGMLGIAAVVGPRRQSAVKQMPYESGMDPIHDAHRNFDVRFHLVAIAFLVFDVELLNFVAGVLVVGETTHQKRSLSPGAS